MNQRGHDHTSNEVPLSELSSFYYKGDYGSERTKATADPETIMNNLQRCLSELSKYFNELSPTKKADFMDTVEKLKVKLVIVIRILLEFIRIRRFLTYSQKISLNKW